MSTEDNTTAIFYITKNGLSLGQKLKGLYPDAKVLKFNSMMVSEAWNKCENLIFVMATGIVVRTIAPLIKDKKTDPAVVVMDEKGKNAISLLSGHLGGANENAEKIAGFLSGRAVITTATDVNRVPSIDLWARDNNLVMDNWELLPHISTRLLDNGTLRVYSEIAISLPDIFLKVDNPRFADMLITNKIKIPRPHPSLPEGKHFDYSDRHLKGQLYMRPQNIVVGFGCNSGTTEKEIEGAIRGILEKHNLAFSSIHSIATIDKKGSEPGLMAFANRYNLKINTFSSAKLNSITGIARSEAAYKATGANAVSEPAAILASGADSLLVKKIKSGNVTVAIALLRSSPHVPCPPSFRGKIYIVGTGPGSIKHITQHAREAIKKSDVIVGYGAYLDLIEELIKDKETVSTVMTQEVERCRKAVELASAGKTVSIISGGDPGVYAMAGLVLEVLKNRDVLCEMGEGLNNKDSSRVTHNAPLPIEVIPGVSALNACAARLGAPLMHDFASISLSDRLTPWELIEKRLEAAAIADFVIVLYNPKSRGRTEHIHKAQEIVLKHRSPETPVGIVKSATRENEKIVISDLRNMLSHEIDMQTTLIIGNSKTFIWNSWMITPRGYEKKFKI